MVCFQLPHSCKCSHVILDCVMMMSSNGNIFHVTGPCEGNSLVTSEFPSQRPVTRSFDVFFDLRLNKRLSKPSRCGDLRCHHAHYDVTLMFKWHSPEVVWQSLVQFHVPTMSQELGVTNFTVLLAQYLQIMNPYLRDRTFGFSTFVFTFHNYKLQANAIKRVAWLLPRIYRYAKMVR